MPTILLYLVTLALLLVLLLDAMSRLALARLLIVGLLMATVAYPLIKNATRSPKQAYTTTRTIAAATAPPQTGPFIEPPHKGFGRKFKAAWCHTFQRHDQPEKSGRIRDRIRKACTDPAIDPQTGKEQDQ
jgi:hypothetical protein